MYFANPISILFDTGESLWLKADDKFTMITFQRGGRQPETQHLCGGAYIALLETTCMLAQVLKTSEQADEQADQVLERIRGNLRILLGPHGDFMSGCIIATIQC